MARCNSWIGRATRSRVALLVANSDAVKRDFDARFVARAHPVDLATAGTSWNCRIYPVVDGKLVSHESVLTFVAMRGEQTERQVKAETEANRINRWLREINRNVEYFPDEQQ